MAYDPAIQKILDQINGAQSGGPAIAGGFKAITLPKGFKPQAVASVSNSGNPNPNHHESNFHKVLDFLSRGQAASAGAFLGGFDPKNKGPLHYDFGKAVQGFNAGIGGETHHSFDEVLKQHGHTGTGMGTLGFGLNVLADPLTYAGGLGLVGKAGKVAEGAEALTGVQKISRALEALKPATPIHDAKAVASGVTTIASKIGKPIETAADIAAPAAAVGNALKDAKLPSALKGSPRYGGFGVNRTVQFPDDVTKALYIVQGVKKSAAHDQYMDFLRGHFPHLDDAAIGAMGSEVRNSIKAQAKNLPKNVNNIVAESHSAVNAGPIQTTKPLSQISELLPALTPSKFEPVKTFNDLPPEVQKTAGARAKELTGLRFDKEFPHKAYYQESGAPTIGDLYKPTRAEVNADPALKEHLMGSQTFKDFHAQSIAQARQEVLAEHNASLQQAHEAAATAPLTAVPGAPLTTTPPSPVQQILENHPNPAGIVPESTSNKYLSATGNLTKGQKTLAEDAALRTISNIKNLPDRYGGNFTAGAQVGLRNYISSRALKRTWQGLKEGKNTPEWHDHVNQIYKAAELRVEQEGLKAVKGPKDTSPLRLSSILDNLPHEEIINGPAQRLNQIAMGTAKDEFGQKLHNAALVAGHVEEANRVLPVVDATAEAAQNAAAGGVKGVADFAAHAEKQATLAAKQAGATPLGVVTAGTA